MPETMIELDVSSPWRPPEAVPGRRPGRRGMAMSAVLVVAGALLCAAAPRRTLAPLFVAEDQVVGVQAAGGRLLLLRPRTAGAGPLLQAVSARDGAPLWSRAVEAETQLVQSTERVVLLEQERTDAAGDNSLLTVLDARTGAVLWQRAKTEQLGLFADHVLVSDRIADAGPEGLDTSYGDPEDPTISLPMLPRRLRYLALELQTGRVAWTVELPPRTEPALTIWWYGRYAGLSDLDADGVLRVRDPGTGAVTSTRRLDRSGVVARHHEGVAGQEVVYHAGERGADVFDRGTGRLLWHWAGPGDVYAGPYPCRPDRYCVSVENGVEMLDPATGNLLWRTGQYSNLLPTAGGRLLLYAGGRTDDDPDDIAAFDAATGAVRWRLPGWTVMDTFLFGTGERGVNGGLFVWRTVNFRDAVLGVLDPDTGAVEVFGRAPDFYGNPVCALDGDRLACDAAGGLTVWRVP